MIKLSSCVLLSTLGIVALSTPAHAFCRTTTASGALEPVARDADGCVVEGVPLSWAQSCIPLGVHRDGSPKLGLSFEEAHEVVSEAWSVWERAECDDGPVQLSFLDRGVMHCDEVEFLEGAVVSNNNILFFRDEWPHSGSAQMLALTTLTFDVRTGEILDADVEVNSDGIPYDDGVDLKSALIHEFGHLLGLAHSMHEDSVMVANTSRSERRHSLGADDVAAVCSMAGGGTGVSCDAEKVDVDFTRECAELADVEASCALRAGRMAGGGFWSGLFTVGWIVVRRRRNCVQRWRVRVPRKTNCFTVSRSRADTD